MRLEDYQNFVYHGLEDRKQRLKRPSDTSSLLLEMTGEVGEMINAFKHEKIWQPEKEINPGIKYIKTKDELGDVLWYFTAVATSLGLTLDEIAEHNMKKINERYK